MVIVALIELQRYQLNWNVMRHAAVYMACMALALFSPDLKITRLPAAFACLFCYEVLPGLAG